MWIYIIKGILGLDGQAESENISAMPNAEGVPWYGMESQNPGGEINTAFPRV